MGTFKISEYITPTSKLKSLSTLTKALSMPFMFTRTVGHTPITFAKVAKKDSTAFLKSNGNQEDNEKNTYIRFQFSWSSWLAVVSSFRQVSYIFGALFFLYRILQGDYPMSTLAGAFKV